MLLCRKSKELEASIKELDARRVRRAGVFAPILLPRGYAKRKGRHTWKREKRYNYQWKDRETASL